MKRYPVALSVAGSDPSGGAGIQADLKTFSALGVYGAAAVTAVTVQNTKGVKYVHSVPAQVVYDQIVAVMEDLHPDAVKIGMVNDAATLDAIINALTDCRPHFLVVDPVMVSSSGKMLMSSDALILLEKILLPMTDLLTPNIPETLVLTGMPSVSANDVEAAARAILDYGTRSVLIKGGHASSCVKTDVLFSILDGNISLNEYSAPSVASRNTHGTGCTLSSAIAAFVARGDSLVEAVGEAKRYLTSALVAGADITIGDGTGPLNHFFSPVPAIVIDKE